MQRWSERGRYTERERDGERERERERGSARARAREHARQVHVPASLSACATFGRVRQASPQFLCLFLFCVFFPLSCFFFVFLTALEHFYFLFAAFHLSLSPPCASLAYIHAQAEEADGLSLFSHLLARRLQACMRDQGEPPGSLVCMYDVICDNIVIMCMYV